MLIISAGMQKSGSAYIYNLINDILIISGGKDTREIKEKYKLNKLMKWHNNNIGRLYFWRLIKLVRISSKEGQYVVKTHKGPTLFHNLLLKGGFLKTIYIYRDPRDILLSVQDYGKKIIESGSHHTFAELVDFDDAFRAIKKWLKVYKLYKQSKGVLLIRYEDLLNEPKLTMEKISHFLNVGISEENIERILIKYDRKNPNANKKGLHFNKAITNRYISELTPRQIERFKLEMGDIIEDMGYKV